MEGVKYLLEILIHNHLHFILLMTTSFYLDQIKIHLLMKLLIFAKNMKLIS